MRTVFRVWTPERRKVAEELLAKGYRNAYVAEQLGLTKGQVESYVYCMRGNRVSTKPPTVNTWIQPSSEAVTERDRRQQAGYARDLTAQLCGDPPRGYSALDLKMRGQR